MRIHRDEQGQGVVEFVLLVPIIVFLVWATWFFSELVRERIRVQQAARYAAFASAHSALTNYNGAISIPYYDAPTSDFRWANLKVAAEMTRIYGDIHLPIPGQLGSIADSVLNTTLTQRLRQKPSTFSTDATPPDYQLGPTPYFPDQSINAAVHWLGGGNDTFADALDIVGEVVDWMIAVGLNRFGFGGKAKVTVDVGVRLDNKLLPLNFLAGPASGKAHDAITGLKHLELRERVTILADSWVLGDGRDVWRGGMAIDKKKEVEAPMHKQVDRIKFLHKAVLPSDIQEIASGLAKKAGGAIDLINTLTGGERYGNIFSGRVTSLNYRDGEGMVDVFEQAKTDGRGTRNFHTGDMAQEPLNLRGNHWLGCNKAQQGDCDFR